MTNTAPTNPQSIDEQTPSATQDLLHLSPDPAREIILKHTQENRTTKPMNNNHSTTIQEEWIIPDEILPDENWNLASKSNTKEKIQSNT